MLKIGINGFGRIGRAIFKNAICYDDVKIVGVNDINPEIENLGYLLKYDSYYGRFNKDISVEGNKISVGSNKIEIFQKYKIADVPWFDLGCDLVIEALGFDPENIPMVFNEPNLQVTQRGTITIDFKNMMSKINGVFAAGDIVRGASLVVWGIKDGRDVAANIHNYLEERSSTYVKLSNKEVTHAI